MGDESERGGEANAKTEPTAEVAIFLDDERGTTKAQVKSVVAADARVVRSRGLDVRPPVRESLVIVRRVRGKRALAVVVASP